MAPKPASVGKRSAPSTPSARTGSKKGKVDHHSPAGPSPTTLSALWSQKKTPEATTEPLVSKAVDAQPEPEVVDPPIDTAEAVSHAHLSDEELKELKRFDLSQKFGPSVGPTRMQRWR